MRKETDNVKRAMTLLGAIALAISFILCIHAFSGRGLIGCSAGSSCDSVLGSRWSFILGVVPVSGLACVLYSLFTACAWLEGRTDDPRQDHLLRCILLTLSGAIICSAVWFIWLQSVRIGAFCPYCMSAHVIGCLASFLAMVHCFARESRRNGVFCIVGGESLAAGLVMLQIATTPLTAYERGFVPEDLPDMARFDLPKAGGEDAEHHLLLLFDYQCSHCQKIHRMLPEALAMLGGKVDVTLCPSPLSPECNPYVPSGGVDNFKGSCELARLALALWYSNREAFRAFDGWLFDSEGERWSPRPVEDAYAMAAELAGREALGQALANERINDYLSAVSELFGRTSTEGNGTIPRFICGTSRMTPDAADAAGLADTLKKLIEE